MILLDGVRIARLLRQDIALKVQQRLQEGKRAPHLGIVMAEGNPANEVYVANKIRAAEQTGITATLFRLPANVSAGELLAIIDRLNNDGDIDGYIVQLPLPEHLDVRRIIQAISPQKDMDRDIQQDAVRLLLQMSGVDIERRQVIITENNVPCSLLGSQVPQGAVVIDMGFTRQDDPLSPKGYRIVGDTDMASVSSKAAYLAPVPGGIGPVIIATLLLHTLQAAK
jgi:methylenetetrahydrofolate dehydrogenase (NADP+)/methenyltetrahydrofolate cyclohydrolase